MVDIFEHCSSVMYETRCEFFGTYLDPADPLHEVLKRFRPHFEKSIYTQNPLQEHFLTSVYFYVDCRDTIF